MNTKVALITGITGQDGSFLAEFLLQKGYEVHGILRRSSSFNTGRIEHLYFDEWVRDMKPFVFFISKKRPKYIRRPLRSYSDWFKKSRRKKQHRSIPVLRTV